MFPFSDNNPTRRVAYVTYAVVVANVLCFLWLTTRSPLDQAEIVAMHGFIPARIAQLRDGKPRIIDLGEVADQPHAPPGVRDVRQVQRAQLPLTPDRKQILSTLFTCMFLHGGWMHLIGNMWFLFIFGNNVEDRLGHFGYVIFYLLCGLIATACHWLTGPNSATPVIGASGAIAGVLGGYIITFPHARVRTLITLGIIFFIWELPAYVVLGFWIVMQVLEATRELGTGVGGGVALFAHIGGFVAGVLIMPLMREKEPPPPSDFTPDWQRADMYRSY